MLLRRLLTILLISLLVFATTGGARAQDGGPVEPQVGEAVTALAGTGFTYQGDLRNGGSPVNATCDFQFGLYDAVTLGAQQGSTQTVSSVGVANGRFTVTLNSAGQFGARAFDGSARWLATSVRCPAGSGGYTSLTPRQPLTAAPLAFALPGLRTEPNATSPNLIGGYISNTVTGGAYGVVIAGGGQAGGLNTITANYGVIGGGFANIAGGFAATVGGGQNNGAITNFATIGGGYANEAIGEEATIAGGDSNVASGAGAFIGGGGWDGSDTAGNTAAGAVSVIGGGLSNTANGTGAFIGGGSGNVVTTTTAYGTISGGYGNTVSGQYATVGGGNSNTAAFYGATVAGGEANVASGAGAFIGGGGFSGSGTAGNTASGAASVVGGGTDNTASGAGAFIGGGGWNGTTVDGNTAAGSVSTIGGGYGNVVTTTATYGTIGGGWLNVVAGYGALVAGGTGNTASNTSATVGGGESNTASGVGATVSGGYTNAASGAGAVVGGGGWTGTWFAGNTAAGTASTIGGGYNNVVTTTAPYGVIGGGVTNTVTGLAAVVPGGQQNSALGNYSFAGGYGSTAAHTGAFVWTCASCAFTTSSANDQFVANASGGFWFGKIGSGPVGSIAGTQAISTSTGAFLSTAGLWTDVSDRNAKMNFAPVSVLDALIRLPVESWQYKVDDANVRHIGPTAQDFYAAFGVGQDDTHLAALDTGGVALAAIKELATVVETKDAEIAALTARVDALEQSGPASDKPAPLAAALPWLLLAGLGLLNLGGLAGYALAKRGGKRA